MTTGQRGSVFRRCPKARGSACDAGRCTHRWAYYVEMAPGGDGRRRQLSKGGFATKREAQRALDDAKATMAHTSDHRAGAKTVEVYLQDWLDAKATLRATTRRSYQGHLDGYLVPHLGKLRLRDLTPGHVEAMYRAILKGNGAAGRKVGPTTVRRVHATLSSALNKAVKQRLLAHNPAQYVELPAANTAKVNPWQPAELGCFLDYAAGDRLGTLYELVAMTGLRRGEVCGLRWQDVDLERRELHVRQQLVQSGGTTVVGKPKTKGGEDRVVDLDERTVAALLTHQLRQAVERDAWGAAWHDTGLVFTREDGAALIPEYVTRHFQRLSREAGLRVVRLHDLRHGQASLALAAGVPLAVVSKRLGHSSYHLTADTYSHLLHGVGRQAAEAAAALVPRASLATP